MGMVTSTKLLIMCPECMGFIFVPPEDEVKVATSAVLVCGGCRREYTTPDEIDEYVNVTSQDVYTYLESLEQEGGESYDDEEKV